MSWKRWPLSWAGPGPHHLPQAPVFLFLLSFGINHLERESVCVHTTLGESCISTGSTRCCRRPCPSAPRTWTQVHLSPAPAHTLQERSQAGLPERPCAPGARRRDPTSSPHRHDSTLTPANPEVSMPRGWPGVGPGGCQPSLCPAAPQGKQEREGRMEQQAPQQHMTPEAAPKHRCPGTPPSPAEQRARRLGSGDRGPQHPLEPWEATGQPCEGGHFNFLNAVKLYNARSLFSAVMIMHE